LGSENEISILYMISSSRIVEPPVIVQEDYEATMRTDQEDTGGIITYFNYIKI